MSTPAEAIVRHLAEQGVGGLGDGSGWRLYAFAEPASPDTTVTVYDTGGRDPLLYDSDLRQPTIQVRVRSANYVDAYAKHTEIIDALHNVIDQAIDGMQYVGCWMTGDVIPIGRDDNNRHRLTANFQIIRQPIAQEA